ncbi:MAG: MoaD/ThiS family protein [Rhodospirillaceae bacterium]|jgi:sulfur carrier protein ThiS|nr:MoaD/ThiS family protein [Rhodospirillaceae bacterium]
MKVKIKLLSMAGGPPPGFDEFGERTVDAASATNVADVVASLSLPSEESYTTIVNGEAVPVDARAGHVLSDGDEITLFPAIQGG